MHKVEMPELLPQTRSPSDIIGYTLMHEVELSMQPAIAHFSVTEDTYSGSKPNDYALVQHWLEEQMRFSSFAYVVIKTDSIPGRIDVIQSWMRPSEDSTGSLSQPYLKAHPLPLDDFEQGVHGYIRPRPETVNMASRLIQAGLSANPKSAEIVHDDDDGMLLLEFTLQSGLVVEAELDINGIINASAYGDNAEDEDVKYLLNASENEFVGLFV